MMSMKVGMGERRWGMMQMMTRRRINMCKENIGDF
jgi:hypothetical protein